MVYVSNKQVLFYLLGVYKYLTFEWIKQKQQCPQNLSKKLRFKNKIWVKSLGFGLGMFYSLFYPSFRSSCFVPLLSGLCKLQRNSKIHEPNRVYQSQSLMCEGTGKDYAGGHWKVSSFQLKNHKEIYQWPLSTSHEHILLMTLAAFWELKVICLFSFVRKLILSQET